MNKPVIELDPQELKAAVGGLDDNDPFIIYANYVDSLYEKYGCRGMGMKYLKTVCTPEEKARIRELWNNV